MNGELGIIYFLGRVHALLFSYNRLTNKPLLVGK